MDTRFPANVDINSAAGRQQIQFKTSLRFARLHQTAIISITFGRRSAIPQQGAPLIHHSPMTKTYAQIVKQIEILKQDAEKVRRKEIEGVIGRIREAINVYNLTAEDLGFGGRAAKVASKAAAPAKKRGRKAAKAEAVVKFRNESGGTWGGRGKRPQWLRDALNAGKTLQDFAVK
jgi:DNA-binding protein H-NS